MGTVRVVEDGSIAWTGVTPEQQARFEERGIVLTPEELAGTSRYHHRGSEMEPELLEVRLDPGTVVNAHAHRRDEIIYVVEGALVLGNRVLPPGSSVLITADTLYSFRAGPEGLRFANFRPTSGAGYMGKDEFMAERRARGELTVEAVDDEVS